MIRGLLAEALDLHRLASDGMPSAEAPAQSIYETLIRVRGYIDRLSEVYGRAIAMEGSARRAARRDADVASDTFDESSVAQRRAGRREEWTTGRERQADISLTMLQQTRELRAAQRLADECKEARDRIKLIYDNMEGQRRDLHAGLGHHKWESHLDR